jgi:glutaredoxin-related protein
MTVISLTISPIARADSCSQDCKDALKAADEIIADQDKVINLQLQEIKLVRTNFEQALDHADQYKRESEFKTNLLYIGIPAAIIGGFLLSQGLKK